MAYLKPPFFVRAVFNKLAMRFGIGGTETLAVVKRTSGDIQTVPVIPFDHEGTRYVVSTRGESQWVENLRAAGKAELRSKAGATAYDASEVPVAERAPLLAAYKQKAGRTVDAYFKKLPDDSDHPTFRLTPMA